MPVSPQQDSSGDKNVIQELPQAQEVSKVFVLFTFGFCSGLFFFFSSETIPVELKLYKGLPAAVKD